MNRIAICFTLLLALSAGAALAAAVPMDEPSFTAYIQKRLQLYAPEPISVTGPFTLSAGTASDAKNLPSLVPLHDACLSEPTKCEAAADTYVQNVVHDVLQKAAPASEAAQGTTTLVACNHTTHALAIASIYIPVSGEQWRSAGWTNVDSGTCRGILVTAKDTFYARAEVANRSQVHDPNFMRGMADSDNGIANAGGDANWCVRHEGNWDLQARTLRETCGGEARESASFKTFHAVGKPMIVWNLGS
jgi:uncharacterized membrane protein